VKRLSFFILIIFFAAPLFGEPQTARPPRLTLPQAETLLLQRNLLIAANRYQLDASEALLRIAGYKPNPVLQLGAEQIPFLSNIPGSVPRFFTTNSDAGANPVYTVQFNKIIERGHKREIRMEQATANVEAAKAQIQDTFRTQLFQLRQAFSSAVLARENLRLAETLDNQYDRTEQLTKVRVDAGDSAPVELYRVRSGRLQYKQALFDAQTAYNQASRDVLNLLNLRPEDLANSVAAVYDRRQSLIPVSWAVIDRPYSDSDPQDVFPALLQSAPVDLSGSLTDQQLPMTPDQLINTALAERPDIQVAKANLTAAIQATKLAQAQRTRDVSVGVEYQRVGNDHAAGVVTQIPLFLYNDHTTEIAQAEAQQKAAEAQLQQLDRQVRTDVAKAYESYLAARRSMALYNSDNLVQVDKLRTIADFSYRSGGTSLFELLDAQRVANQAAVAYNQARFNYQLSLWQMEQAVGRPLESVK
jgi:cobalt-zinc-cadmium efflux system outer membrane protein